MPNFPFSSRGIYFLMTASSEPYALGRYCPPKTGDDPSDGSSQLSKNWFNSWRDYLNSSIAAKVKAFEVSWSLLANNVYSIFSWCGGWGNVYTFCVQSLRTFALDFSHFAGVGKVPTYNLPQLVEDEPTVLYKNWHSYVCKVLARIIHWWFIRKILI